MPRATDVSNALPHKKVKPMTASDVEKEKARDKKFSEQTPKKKSGKS